jgi:hypothetical protein
LCIDRQLLILLLLEGKPRVEVASGPLAVRAGRRWDRDGYAAEEFSLSDNLMITGAIRAAGGSLIVQESANGVEGSTLSDQHERLAAFEAFEACLRVAAGDAGTGHG